MSNNTCPVPSCGKSIYCKGYCRPHYQRVLKYGDPLGQAPVKPQKNCEVDGCSNRARTKSSALCAKHYHREYRHGNIDANFHGLKTAPEGRYRTQYDPRHPLASANGIVYVHRSVLHSLIGPGPHECHWCGVQVNWSLTVGASDYLQVDHLDENKENNNPGNLVPSCNRCNTTRSTQKKHDIVRAMGGWSRNDTIAMLKDPHQRRSTMEFANR